MQGTTLVAMPMSCQKSASLSKWPRACAPISGFRGVSANLVRQALACCGDVPRMACHSLPSLSLGQESHAHLSCGQSCLSISAVAWRLGVEECIVVESKHNERELNMWQAAMAAQPISVTHSHSVAVH